MPTLIGSGRQTMPGQKASNSARSVRGAAGDAGDGAEDDVGASPSRAAASPEIFGTAQIRTAAATAD
ncbi:hypothetical protein AB0M20_36410, partial [Actinoplanes sp. NPDC051633]|uniref:hypothetical protein n=1 Tax=Actinoplanes sp. NPDC051633 TaxID=3155670 RepID=UPI0034339829